MRLRRRALVFRPDRDNGIDSGLKKCKGFNSQPTSAAAFDARRRAEFSRRRAPSSPLAAHFCSGEKALDYLYAAIVGVRPALVE
jgi:hypothetical protein